MGDTLAKSIKRARFIKRERKQRAWTQSQLAQISGVTLRTIQRVEKDGSASFETLMGIADAFDIDVKELNSLISIKRNSSSSKAVYLLPRIKSGGHLTKLIDGADQFQFEHDDLSDERSLGAMKNIMTMVKEDVVRLYDADQVQRIEFESVMTKEINNLETYGFHLFGIRREIPNTDPNTGNLVTMTTIYMSHLNSPKIVTNRNNNMVVPALLTEAAK